MNSCARLTVVLIMLALAACTVPMERRERVTLPQDAWIAATQSTPSPAAPVVPPDISLALLPEVSSPAPAVIAERRFDIAATNVSARDVYLGLVEGTRYSVAIHPQVEGNITLNLKQATVLEALATLHEFYGYEYRREGDRFLILPPGVQTRLFNLSYLNLQRKGRSDTKVSSTGLKAGTGADAGNVGVEIETKSESDFWKEMEIALKSIVGEGEGRGVVVQPQAGIVIVKALPKEIRMVQNFIENTQASITRQVVLEAKIIEVELKDGMQSGVNWALLGNIGNLSGLASQTGGGKSVNTGLSDIAAQPGNLIPDSRFAPIDSTKISAFGGIFTLALKWNDFSTFVELLQTQGDVRVLSSPRVSTVNNQKAVIKVGGDEFFVTNITSGTSSTGSTTATGPSVELTPFFSGIALDVTPQIDEQNRVLLHIHPTISDVTYKDRTFILGDLDYSLPVAFSNVQESDNVVHARSGEIIVIGGLMKEALTEARTSVPVLGDLPLVGKLFRHQKMVRIKKELVILLRPTVIENGARLTDAGAGAVR